jgi:hypothetical protein
MPFEELLSRALRENPDSPVPAPSTDSRMPLAADHAPPPEFSSPIAEDAEEVPAEWQRLEHGGCEGGRYPDEEDQRRQQRPQHEYGAATNKHWEQYAGEGDDGRGSETDEFIGLEQRVSREGPLSEEEQGQPAPAGFSPRYEAYEHDEQAELVNSDPDEMKDGKTAPSNVTRWLDSDRSDGAAYPVGYSGNNGDGCHGSDYAPDDGAAYSEKDHRGYGTVHPPEYARDYGDSSSGTGPVVAVDLPHRLSPPARQDEYGRPPVRDEIHADAPASAAGSGPPGTWDHNQLASKSLAEIASMDLDDLGLFDGQSELNLLQAVSTDDHRPGPPGAAKRP